MTTTVNDGATRVDEIADDIFRVSTKVPPSVVPGGFTFNQYLIRDDEPLLFHTGPRWMYDAVRAGIGRVMPVARLRYVALSHFEADECGAMNRFLADAPAAEPVCGRIAAMVSVGDFADRPPRALADQEALSLGRHAVRWIDTPHLPHGWECGYLADLTTETLFCGDLFTQPGAEHAPLTEADILEPSEAMRARLDYFSHTREVDALIGKLTATRPRMLACMHGSAWRGDGAALLTTLGRRLDG
jgi:flavorubredoxin